MYEEHWNFKFMNLLYKQFVFTWKVCIYGIIICGFDWPKTLYNTDDVYKINIICFCKTQTESINFINHYKPPFV